MSETAVDKFDCAGCGKRYTWKPELAGRKVKCKCGAVMTVPEQPPAPPQEAENDLYDLAEEPAPAKKSAAAPPGTTPCANCGQSIPATVLVCPVCGYNRQTGKIVAGAAKTKPKSAPAAPSPAAKAGGPPSAVLAYAGTATSRRGIDENALGGETWRELYLPGGLVILGLVMQIWLNMYDGGSWRSFTQALPHIGLSLAINLVLSFTGILIVARLMEVSFGAPIPAIIKTIACCLLPPAIAAFIGGWVGSDSAFVNVMAQSVVFFPLCWLCFWFMFSLEADEAMYCVAVIYLVNVWIVNFLMAMMFASGAGGGALSTLGGLGGSDDENPQAIATQQIDQKIAQEARAWLAESGNRLLGRLTREQSVRGVDTFYQLGALKVYILPDGGQARKVIVELPKNKDARKKILEYCTQFHGQQEDDSGQKFLIFVYQSY